MADNPTSDKRKYFTVEQANAMLPLVRAIVKDLADLSREVIDRRERLAHCFPGAMRNRPTSIGRNSRRSRKNWKRTACGCANMWKN